MPIRRRLLWSSRRGGYLVSTEQFFDCDAIICAMQTPVLLLVAFESGRLKSLRRLDVQANKQDVSTLLLIAWLRRHRQDVKLVQGMLYGE